MIKDKYFFSFVLLSFLIGLVIYIYFLKNIGNEMLFWGLLIFIPSIVIFEHYLKNIKDKNLHKNKLFIAIKNMSLILFVQIFIFGVILSSISSIYTGYTKDIKHYNNIFAVISEKDKLVHFPKVIPKEAQNIVFSVDTLSFFGSEEVYIAFDIDKKYIENELKKHKFVKIEGPYKDYGGYNMDFTHAMRHLNEKPDGYKVYYLTIRHRDDDETHHFPAINGIAAKGNRIVYFYGSLD